MTGAREAVGRSRRAPDALPSIARDAISDVAPFALAVVPFGLAIGNASAAAGLSGLEAGFGAVSLLAGSGQLAAVEVIAADGGVWLTAMVVALVNLRFMFYGAGIASWFAHLPMWRRLVLAFPIIDQTFILCQGRFESEHDPRRREVYYLTATAVLGSTFLASQFVGFQIGGSFPDDIGLHLAAPLAFVGMLARATTSRESLVAALVASVITVLTASTFGALALPAGVAVGVAAAMWAKEDDR